MTCFYVVGGPIHPWHGVRGYSKEANRSAKRAFAQMRRLGRAGALQRRPCLYWKGKHNLCLLYQITKGITFQNGYGFRSELNYFDSLISKLQLFKSLL